MNNRPLTKATDVATGRGWCCWGQHHVPNAKLTRIDEHRRICDQCAIDRTKATGRSRKR